MAEEKERERRASEESSRPSIDEAESPMRLKPSLDPVAERKSEYDMENLLKDSEPPQDSSSSGPTGKVQESDQFAPALAEPVSTIEPSQRVEPPATAGQDFGSDSDKGHERNHVPNSEEEDTEKQPQTAESLRHTPSDGFTSIVHQAFDDSQTKVPPTPSSASGNSIVRSNSASASDISPIIERAPIDLKARPMSSSTTTPTNTQHLPPQDTDPLPPPIRPGYRRDSRTPSPGNSPARRPSSLNTADTPQEEVGVVSASTPTQTQPEPVEPSSIPRAESPTKGKVRDLAGKLESRSAASSPERGPASVVDASRPSNPHLESFRPALPGGWNSYTTSTGASSPAKGPTPLQSTDDLPRSGPAGPDSPMEDIPTAGPPKPREQGYETSGKAFEALAAAGSALSTAFGSVAGLQQDNSSENGTPTEPPTTDVTPARERFDGLSPVQEVLSAASSAPPSPPAKGALFKQKSSQQGYFPSPLRTSKSSETPTPMRPQMLPALSTDNSPQDTESDRLRKEIVLSLTPKSIKGDSQLRSEYELEPLPMLKPSEASVSPEEGQSNLERVPSEESNFWDEPVQEESATDNNEAQPIQSATPYNPTYIDEAKAQSTGSSADTASGRPMLQKRFSWEVSSEDVGTSAKLPEAAATTTSPTYPPDTVGSPQTIKAPASPAKRPDPPRSNPSDDNVTGRPQDRPTIIPVTASRDDLRSHSPPSPVAKSDDDQRRNIDSESVHPPPDPSHSLSDHAAQSTSAMPFEPAQEKSDLPLPSTTGRDLSFREILGMHTPQERIRAYNSTRQQLAKQDSGLTNWLESTGKQYPEHHDLLHRNGRPSAQHADAPHSHKPSPSRSKFPKIGASLGGAGQQSPAEGHDASKATFGSPSSGKLTSAQVQEEGKKLLHTAGKFGGKAGGAAKGLFAKGKNKFRASSGGEKVDT